MKRPVKGKEEQRRRRGENDEMKRPRYGMYAHLSAPSLTASLFLTSLQASP